MLPKVLYHGTSKANWIKIKKDGFMRGRRIGTNGNWNKVPSSKGCVYLTDSYALYYAAAVTRANNDLAVLKIRTDTLNFLNLVPDEDWMCHAYKTQGYVRDEDNLGSIKLTLALRDAAKLRPDLAEESLKGLGTVAYYGDIKIYEVEKVAIIKSDKYAELCIRFGHDPSITVMNRKLLGEVYKGWMEWLFGGNPEVERLGERFFYPENRDGITIIERPKT